jgi:hypothetical protein
MRDDPMSQCNVERVIGRLVTDEGFRRRFAADPRAAVQEMAERGGLELNACEQRALAAIDPRWIERFADAVDPRIQKIALQGGTQ